MGQKPQYIVILELILHHITRIIGGRFNCNAILIRPHENVNSINIVSYRVEKGLSGAEIMHFSNGFFYPKPEGTPQYSIVKGKRGVMLGFDGNSIWNVLISDKQETLKMMSSVDTDQYISFQTFKELSERFESRAEMNKFLMIGLSIIAITGLMTMIIAFVVWQGIEKAKGAETDTASELHQLKMIELTKYAWENNVSFPEYGIVVDWNNKTSRGSPSLPTSPSLPSFPSIPLLGG